MIRTKYIWIAENSANDIVSAFRTILFLLCFVFFVIPSVAQNKTDSLLKIIEKIPDDTNKIASLNFLATQLGNSEPEKALEYGKRALALSQELNFITGAEEAYNVLGATYYYQNLYPLSLENYLKSLKIAEETADKKQIARCLQNIGNIYIEQNDYSRALEYFTKSLKLKEELGLLNSIPSSIIGIGNIYFHQLNYDSALVYYSKGLRLGEKLKDESTTSICLMNMGVCYMELQEYSKALDALLRSLEIREKLNNQNGVSTCLLNIGDVYIRQRSFKQAIIYLNKALLVSQKAGSLDNQRLSYEGLAKSYEGLNDYKKAYNFYQLFKEYNDSIFNEENSNQLGDLKTQFEVEKKEKEMEAEHDKQVAVAEADKKRQRLLLWLVAAIAAAVTIIAIIISRSLRITRNQKNIIELQKDLVEKQKQEVEQQKQLVEEHQKEIIDSITYAKRLQQAILPSDDEIKKHLPESFIFYKPKDIVAGDFYWLHITENLKNNSEIVFVAAADSTGHGVPGAMVSVVCSNAINRAVNEFNLTDTGKILDKTRELVLETFAKSGEEINDGMDISLLAINYGAKKITWSGANNPLWYIHNNNLVEIQPDKQSIGKTYNSKPFSTHTVDFNKGDIYYLMTDGFADQFGGEKGKKFKYKQLQENLISISNLPLEEQKEKLAFSFEKWKGDLEQVDDVTIIGIRI